MCLQRVEQSTGQVLYHISELSNGLVDDDSEEDNDNDKEYDENVKLIDIDFSNTEITSKLTNLLTDAESAISSGKTTVQFSGLELRVNSKDLNTVKKAMREVIDQTVESLDERFTEKQIEPLEHLTKFVTKLESKESITFLANQYSKEVNENVLLREHVTLKNMIKNHATIFTPLEFSGFVVANFKDTLPQSAFLCEMYMKATLHVVGAERAFSSQNCLITDLKTRMSTNNLSMKILIQSLSRLLPSNILEELLKEAASKFCSEINRKKGAGSL